MHTARVLITRACTRNCSYCCNKYAGIQGRWKNLPKLSDLPHRDVLCITGGEPMEHLDLLRDVLMEASKLKFKTVFLYTARWKPEMYKVVHRVDGIHYTLHSNASMQDVVDVMSMQTLASAFPEKSFRLAISPDIKHAISILPYAWKEVRIKQWRDETDLCIPEHETCYVLGEE